MLFTRRIIKRGNLSKHLLFFWEQTKIKQRGLDSQNKCAKLHLPGQFSQNHFNMINSEAGLSKISKA